MRKIWSSRRTAWTVSLSSWALSRSVPNGFSMITRERSGQPALAEHRDDVGRRRGRHAQVVQEARLLAPSSASAVATISARPSEAVASGT